MSRRPRVVILGGGVGGLAAGWFLARTDRYDVTVVERGSAIGGHCASFAHDGFMLDHGPHKMYSVIPGVLEELRALMGDKLLTHRKRNAIYLRGHRLDYPLQLGNLAKVLGVRCALALGFGYGQAMLSGWFRRKEPASYAEYIRARFGSAAYQLVFEPLAWKVWGEPETLHPDIARARIPASGAAEVLLKLLRLQRDDAQTNAECFYYPRKGFGEFPNALAERIVRHGGRILTESEPRAILHSGPRITSVRIRRQTAEEELPCDLLISSIPLPAVGQMLGGQQDPVFTQAVEGLQFRHLILVYIFLNRPRALEDHWVFFPEREFVFNRIFEPKALSEELGPPERTCVCCDLTCSEGDALWRATDEEVADRCVEGLLRARVIAGRGEVLGSLVKRSRNFYPRYDQAYREKMQVVNRWLQQFENLLCTGRIGLYNYNNSDHCIDMGRFIAQRVSEAAPCPAIWQELEARVATYRIVD